MSLSRLPRLFIGSSVERLEIARTVQEVLQYDLESTVWTQNVFRPTRYTLPELVGGMRTHDFGLFVMAPDDALTVRGRAVMVVRDNVVFEAGLFIGVRDIEHCFLLSPRSSDVHLPSDLAGLSPITYADDRSDGNLVAALEPACNVIRRAVVRSPTKASGDDRLRHYVETWNGHELASARARLKQGVNLDYYDPAAGEERAIIEKVFVFLDSVAEAVLASDIPEGPARQAFEAAMRAAWPWIATSLAPPNHVEDYWNPLPSLAVVLNRWE